MIDRHVLDTDSSVVLDESTNTLVVVLTMAGEAPSRARSLVVLSPQGSALQLGRRRSLAVYLLPCGCDALRGRLICGMAVGRW